MRRPTIGEGVHHGLWVESVSEWSLLFLFPLKPKFGIVGQEKGKKGRRMTEEEKKNAGLALVKQGLAGEGSKRKKRLTVCFLCHRRLDYVSEKGKQCYDRINTASSMSNISSTGSRSEQDDIFFLYSGSHGR